MSPARRLVGRLRRLGRRADPAGALAPGNLPGDDGATIAFRCNLCGTRNRVPHDGLDREQPTCRACGSNVRFRAMGRLVVRELLGRDCALPDLWRKKRWRGIGLSDADACAIPLAAKFDYVNTFYHDEPRLDIANPDVARFGRRDFIVASDVFEHVAPPVVHAFRQARELLNDGGRLILTVPFSLESDTVEHFPDLHDWSVETLPDGHRLRNRTVDGRETFHDDLVFHGGPGSTLEMRVFSRDGLLRDLAAAGFSRTRIADEPCLPFGIAWPVRWSVPVVAYR